MQKPSNERDPRPAAAGALARPQAVVESVLENSSDVIVRYDLALRRIYANPRFERLHGVTPAQYLGKKPSELDLLGPQSAVVLEGWLQSALHSGESQAKDFEWRAPDGRMLWRRIRIVVERDTQGRPTSLLSIATDITARARSEDAWRFITQYGWSDAGEPFFPALVRYLGQSLQLDHVFVDTFDDEQPGIAETVALYAQGEIAPNLRYALKDTPCENVAGRVACTYPRGVQQLFPKDHRLVAMQAESYVGVPLVDASGRAIGLIAATDRQPLVDEDSVTGVLRLVAARACAELVRERTDRALQASEREYRSLAENSPDYIVRFDRQARTLYANPALCTRLGLSLERLLGTTPAGLALPGDEPAMAAYERALAQVLHTGEALEVELVLPGSGEVIETHHVRIVPVKTPDGRTDGALAISRDVSERQRAMALLVHREQEFRALVEHSPDLIERYDLHGHRVYANPALRELQQDSALMGMAPSNEHGAVVVEAERYQRMVHTVLATGRPKRAELRYHLADGGSGWLDVRFCPEEDGEGRIASVFVVSRDITQGVEQREHIKTLALSDPLTRLHNRQALYDYAPGLISEASRHGRQLGVMILDVDRFKDVNDSLGHAAGDRLLCEVAQRIAECTRGYDLLVRLGGDEFAIVATNLDSGLGMATIADKIDRTLSEPLQIAGRQVVVSASIGIALFPADGEQLEDLMAHADAAMYHAKRGGRNRYEFYRAEFSERARDRLALEQALRAAQEGDGLELHYQPLVALDDGRILGAEALLRWRHPDLGLLTPDRFMSIAEETGLIVPIGRWVMDQVAQVARRWNHGRAQPLRLAFNVSTRQFLRDDLVLAVRQALQRNACQPQWLGIEVTESLLLEDSEQVRNTFRELRSIGLEIAIDDFGTGYSALNYLSKFDVQCLKIDRQFVHDIDTDPRQAELVKAFLAIARALGLSVVAEGVETTTQASFLCAHGCAVGQGFLFCRPVPADIFEQALRDECRGRERLSLA
ncbi:EAL domain-containing protein [Aquabacterium sp.]|uniref:EAL domain-containing protein n=1 Tax=Aquabacterium sp. TaxID=1872578 RepID=UPI002C5941D6|nr:EAL domain-containing protein [Aquabacterium sp.]HSW03978.1 EAL domain-containing protein [Aquabacterium sp.]